MPAAPNLLRSERIHAEVLRDEHELQWRYGVDSIGRYSTDQNIEGASQEWIAVCFAWRIRVKILKAKRLREAERRRGFDKSETRVEARECARCERTFLVIVGMGGRVREYHNKACRQKAKRARDLACQAGRGATGSDPSGPTRAGTPTP